MATKSVVSKALQLRVQTGTSSSGAATYGTRTINNLNTELSDADLLVVGNKLAGLQSLPLNAIRSQEVDQYEA